MVQLIQPQKVVHVTTKDGECNIQITLDLNVNLNTGGLEYIQKGHKAGQQNETEEEKVEWAIPDFGSVGKVEFGKKD